MTYKCKQTKIEKTPKYWDMVTLGDVAESISITYDFSGKEKIVFINTGDILEGKFLHKNYSKIDSLPGQAKKTIKSNDILLSEIRPINKRYAFVDFNNTRDYVVSTKLMVIRAKGNILPHFLYRILTNNQTLIEFQHIAESRSGTFPQITFDSIKNYIIPIPPISEQRTIAKILSDLDEKIELNRQMNKTLESIAQAIFKHWFIGFEFPNEEGKPYKSSGGKMVDSKLGDIPKGWEIQSLCRIIEITSGKRPTEKSESKSGEFCVPLYGASSIMGYVKESLCDERILVIGRVGTHGVVQRIKPPAFPSDNTLIIRPKYYEYTYQILKKIDYDAYNVGTTQPLITQSSVKDIDVVIPATLVLMKFESIVNSLYSKIHENFAENEHLSQIRDSLLPKLISGEISTRNI